MVGDGVELFVKVLWLHGLAVDIAVSASFVALLVYLIGLDDGSGLFFGSALLDFFGLGSAWECGIRVTWSAGIGSLGLACWLWQLVWLGIAHMAALLFGCGTGEAWTLVGGLRAGLVFCACDIFLGLVVLW